MAKSYERLSQRKYAEYLGVTNTHVSNAVKNKLIQKGWDVKAKMIIKEIADKEWGDTVRKTPKPESIAVLNRKQHGPVDISDPKAFKTLGADTDVYEAVKREKIARANIAQAEMMEKYGQLVDKAKVQKALIGYGQELKNALEQLPVRTIDSIRAANSRNEALNILEMAIHDVMLRITTVTNKPIE